MNKDVWSEIKSTEWKGWGSRRMSTRLMQHWLVCAKHFKDIYGVEFPDQLYFSENEVTRGYFNKKQLDACGEALLDKLYSMSFEYFYEKKALAQLKDFLSFAKKIKKSLKIKTPQLIELLDEFVKREDIFTNYLWIIFILDEFATDTLESKLKKYLDENNASEKYEDLLKIILSPEKKTAIFQQSLDTLALAKAISSMTPKQKEAGLKKLSNKYAYFTALNFDEEPFGESYFLDEIHKIQKQGLNPSDEIARLNKQFSESKIGFRKILPLLAKDAKLSRLAIACHKMAYYRDHRNDIRREAYLNAGTLYKEISKRTNSNIKDLLFLNRTEIRASLQKGELVVKKNEIEERKKGQVYAYINKKEYYWPDPKKATELINFFSPNKLITEIRGMSASPGKVTGRAKIIFNIGKDGPKLKAGDILVTSMTNIDFVPLMAIASAIVTDEGSRLCHAAIVSREMKKPCIVGTKIATQIIKDDDLIEVNANHGTIKIIKEN